MYSDLFKNFNDDDYVYIIETCLITYASLYSPTDVECEYCRGNDWLLDEGYVKDLKEKYGIKIRKRNLLK